MWQTTGILFTFITALMLTFVFFYLYTQEKDRCFIYITGSWAIYAARFILKAFTPADAPYFVATLHHLFVILSGYLLVYGVYCFTGKRLGNGWLIGAIVAAAVSVSAVFGVVTPLTAVSAAFFYIGIATIASGLAFLTLRSKLGSGIHILSAAMVLWGLHKFDYPFLVNNHDFAPWGFFIGSIMSLITGLGIILVYFGKNRRELIQLNTLLTEHLNEKDSLVNEIKHRVYNNLQIIDSLLYMYPDEFSKEGKLFVETISRRIKIMGTIHQLSVPSIQEESKVPFVRFIRNTIDVMETNLCSGNDCIKLFAGMDEENVNVSKALEMALLLHELVSSSHINYEPDTLDIIISVSRLGKNVTIEYTCNASPRKEGLQDGNAAVSECLIAAFADNLDTDYIYEHSEKGTVFRINVSDELTG
ncbi:histidine kinase dimerization/phosphoacceptor domain -containing protein [Limisalsivibrio acetivorans]|uniref:histidine kinase dimerization/phosphoacceptor domain -containing protein n=1 Tax=Limisalsivibrio acetivorans TaxID=1304888 RepID=UPI0003B4B145|nr:sensor histidine kinase [Limisalsivibrio acetivorans]